MATIAISLWLVFTLVPTLWRPALALSAYLRYTLLITPLENCDFFSSEEPSEETTSSVARLRAAVALAKVSKSKLSYAYH